MNGGFEPAGPYPIAAVPANLRFGFSALPKVTSRGTVGGTSRSRTKIGAEFPLFFKGFALISGPYRRSQFNKINDLGMISLVIDC